MANYGPAPPPFAKWQRQPDGHLELVEAEPTWKSQKKHTVPGEN
jgi:hypothetical protein